MTNYREILRMHSLGFNKTEISQSLTCSRTTVRTVIHLAEGTTGSIMEDGTYDVRAREEESFRFQIGNARNEMTDYCLYRERIYTINHFTLAALTETDPMETLARYPVSIETDQLSRMVIEQENGTRDVFELTYSEVGTEESRGTENKNTVVRCTKNEVENVVLAEDGSAQITGIESLTLQDWSLDGEQLAFTAADAADPKSTCTLLYFVEKLDADSLVVKPISGATLPLSLARQ